MLILEALHGGSAINARLRVVSDPIFVYIIHTEALVGSASTGSASTQKTPIMLWIGVSLD